MHSKREGDSTFLLGFVYSFFIEMIGIEMMEFKVENGIRFSKMIRTNIIYDMIKLSQNICLRTFSKNGFVEHLYPTQFPRNVYWYI